MNATPNCESTRDDFRSPARRSGAPGTIDPAAGRRGAVGAGGRDTDRQQGRRRPDRTGIARTAPGRANAARERCRPVVAAILIDVNPLSGTGAGEHVAKTFEIDLGEEVPELDGPVSGQVRAYRSEAEILVAGRLRAQVNEECRLCLEFLPRSLALDVSGRFVRAGRAELDPNAAGFDPDVGGIAEDGHIDLADLVAQTVLGSLNPFPDCAGACERYSQVKSAFTAPSDPAATDPRLAPFKNLLAEMISEKPPSEDA